MGGRIVHVSSGAASMCATKCSPERRAFLCDPMVTWEGIDTLMREVESFPGGVKDLESHGLGATMGAYGLSKALLNSYTMAVAREQPTLCVNACSPGLVATDL